MWQIDKNTCFCYNCIVSKDYKFKLTLNFGDEFGFDRDSESRVASRCRQATIKNGTNNKRKQ